MSVVIEPPVRESDEVIQILKTTRGLIDQGWTRGSYKEQHGLTDTMFSFCLVGGLRAASYLDPFGDYEQLRDTMIPYYRAHELCRVQLGIENSLENWNDEVARDKDAVLYMLDSVIAKAEGRAAL